MRGLEEQGVEEELGGRVGGSRNKGGGRRDLGAGRKEEGAGRGSRLHCNYNSFTITIRYHRLPGAQQCLEHTVWELRAREVKR